MNEILEIPVTNSSQVEKLKYNAKELILSVTFKTGKTYEYYNVPEIEWNGLTKAESVGKYLNTYVKGVYQFKAI